MSLDRRNCYRYFRTLLPRHGKYRGGHQNSGALFVSLSTVDQLKLMYLLPVRRRRLAGAGSTVYRTSSDVRRPGVSQKLFEIVSFDRDYYSLCQRRGE